MRGAFSERFNQAIEESSILKKTIIRISALVISASVLLALFLYTYIDQASNIRPLTFKIFFTYTVAPTAIGALCAIYVYSNIIYHIRKIIEELSKNSPDWNKLKNEYMESDIKCLYVAIKQLHENLSRQKQIEEAHTETRRVLDKLNSRTDREQREIARHLHDDINPQLILAKLELQKLISIINRHVTDPTQNAESHQIITTSTNFINNVYQDSRNIIKKTRVELIDSIGLTAAIESMVHDYKNALAKKINIRFEHSLPKRPVFSSLTTINAYRIIQEALLNVVKHSQAKNATISVQRDDDNDCRINVCITDDGIGISGKNNQGVGLIDMRERARVLGSSLQIENQTDGGTKICFSFDWGKAEYFES